ncbi:unnamed protein product [Calypogeia fissa]
MELASALWAGCITMLVVSVTYLRIWRPYKQHAFYRRQGLNGPEYRPLIGNWMDVWNLQRKFPKIERHYAHPAADMAVRSLPHLFHWSKLYGSIFTYMEGTQVNLCLLDIDMIRELLVSKSDCYRRNPTGWFWRNNAGPGRSFLEQLDKSKAPKVMTHCRPDRLSTLPSILGPGTDYDIHTVQGILQRAIDQCKTLVTRWEQVIDEGWDVGDGRVEVDATHDIAKTSMIIVLTNLIGSSRDLDSTLNSDRDELVNATRARPLFGDCRSKIDGWLDRLLTETVRDRFLSFERQARRDPRDLLDLMVSSSYHSGRKDIRKVVGDCKMMVAAQKSTTCLVSNTLLLLARHTDWQVQARAEVQCIQPLSSAFDEDADGWNLIYPKLAKLKVLNMILNESLRLAPPIISIEKRCQKRNRLGKYTVLPGTVVRMPIVLLHHSQELWGEDCASFRPDRFEHNSGRRKPFALLPFSAGPSVCLGFNFALLEAKIVLASILSSFSFRLSPEFLGGTPFLSIRKLQLEDFAQAAEERLRRTRSNFF